MGGDVVSLPVAYAVFRHVLRSGKLRRLESHQVILENLEMRDSEKHNMQRHEIVKREVERRMRSGAFVDRIEN